MSILQTLAIGLAGLLGLATLGVVAVVLVPAWVALGFLASKVAVGKGRDAGDWWWIGFLAGPFAAIAAYVLPADTEALEESAVAGGTMQKCPDCAELVRVEAVKCRFCGAGLPASGRPRRSAG